MTGRRAKVVFGLVVTVVLLWWTLRDVSMAEVLREVRRANPWLLLAAALVATGGFVLRAFRWHVLLLPAGPRTSFHSRFGAVCIGFMANNLLPVRLGEFARAYALSRSAPVGLSPSLASLVVERVFDGLVLALFLAGSLFLGALGGTASAGPDGGTWLGMGGDDPAEFLRRAALIGFVLFAAGIVLLGLLARFPRRTIGAFERTIGRLLTPTLNDRAVRVLAAFTRGLGALHDPGIFLRAFIWTVVVWLWLAASIWLGLLAFGITEPGFAGSVFLQGVISFAVAIPSSPGFFGPFEAAVRLGLGAFGVDEARTVGFAIAYHITTFIPVTLLGLWYLRDFGLRWTEIEHSEQLAEEAAEEEEGREPGGPAEGPVGPEGRRAEKRRPAEGEGGA